ncbi:MAG: RNA methyltransferase [Acidobacteriota bacterium]|jgi:TrmH family RNA methyltransferase|nr:RNA methyltransferase [Acidobacteriota bacterium]
MSLDNVVVILVGTKHPGNIGSAARALANMGVKRLVLAAPRCEVNEESQRLAKAGADVLASAKAYPSLRAAVAGVGLLVGTTGKEGGYRAGAATPRALAPRILAHAAGQDVGIVFGPEDTGLVDEDLRLCQLLVRIPTDRDARSLNLAQAVMIVAYELMLGSLAREPGRALKLARVEQVEAMYAQLEAALLEIGFLQPQNAQHMMFALRKLLGRAGLESSDVGVLRGIARQIGWCAKKQGRASKNP